MGLLSKAAVKTSPVLDEMGKALRDRILRLPKAGNTPETALNLLKAYLSFRKALCLSLSGGSYETYASSGAAAEPARIPAEKIFSPERGAGFFYAESDGIDAGGFFPGSGITGGVWIFPLDSGKPWRQVLLISAEGKAGFSAENTAAMLAETAETLVPPDAAGRASPRAGAAGQGKSGAKLSRTAPDTGEENDPQAFLEKFAAASKTFQGIVLKAADGAPDRSLTALVSNMVCHTGAACALPGGDCLVLADAGADRELLAHRLANAVKTKVLLQFSADSAAAALKELAACGGPARQAAKALPGNE
jgi:hypothetical protein